MLICCMIDHRVAIDQVMANFDVLHQNHSHTEPIPNVVNHIFILILGICLFIGLTPLP